MKKLSTDDLVIGYFVAVIVFVTMVILAPAAFAGEREIADEININSGNTRTVDRSQDLDAESNAAAQAAAEAAGGDGGGGGSSKVTTENRSSSIVLTGAKDTADCFTKVGLGAEGFGVFWSRSDAFCKKVRLIARKINEGNFAAATRLECTLKEWKEVYGHRNVRDSGYKQCQADLMPAPTGVNLTHDEYHDLTMAQVQKEEFDDVVEQAEFRYAQQQNLIDSLEKEQIDKNTEIDKLKREAASVRATQNERIEEQASKKAALKELFPEEEEDEME